MNDWKSVKGKFFSQTELANMTEARRITFLRFCEQFMIPSKDGPKYSNTKELWLDAERIMDMPDHPFQEYLWRINFFSTDKDASYRKFFAKLLTLMNTILKYLQINPSLITDDMRKIMEIYPRFSWALTQTAIVPTINGGEVVVQKSGTAPFEQRLYEVGLKTVNMLERLVDSISEKDLKEMKGRDKLIAIGRMGYIFTVAKNLKPNKQVYKQFNFVNASAEDLEKVLLQKDE